MTVPDEITELVERFERNREAYRSPHYKETQLRREFIDPFFVALGWDVENKQGYAEAYKDVVHEDAVKIGGGTKAPDYCFRTGGTRKFFVETKKPAVNIKSDVSPAYQLRRYAWSAKLPLSILTDFEEFAVYDCRVKPSAGDKPSVGRTLYFDYTQYAERWGEIASIFAREAVLKGSFDKYAEKKRKRGTAEVDAAFLKDIEAWREELARGIALRNPKLTTRELNFAVQRTIDRIIFLRICEDRGIEQLDRLRALLNGTQVYARLFKIFQDADDRYNSGLFHFEEEKGRAEGPDELTPGLEIDDKLLKTIIKGLYYPDSPYEFSVLPADILGQVYEQFLGKVIRLTKGHRAVVEDKPEVKKAGGVYYTPTYIVDYIVQNTVGKLLEKSTPEKAAKLRILDPACGSGSFLIGAYQYLLGWHRRYYEEHDPATWAKKRPARVYEGRGGWRLTTAERKRILLNNIYGVDIDTQAVEVTKLSLLLKVLEGESGETLERQRRMFHERALPDLASNVKCGNSLIGPDFYDGTQLAFLDDEERYRINVFDWPREFPDIMRAGGFDAVIGNPPWGAAFDESQKPFLRSHFTLHSGKYESYFYFIEKATELLAARGFFGFIVPSYWISRSQTTALREHLFGQLWPDSIIVLPENVFTGVKMDACILTASREKQPVILVSEVAKKELPECQSASALRGRCRRIQCEVWQRNPSLRFNPRVSGHDQQVISRIEENTVPLSDFVEITQGLTLYRRSTLAKIHGKAKAEEIVTKRSFHATSKKDDTYKKELLGRDISRYFVRWNGQSWISYGPWLAHAVDDRFFRGPRLVIQKLRNPTLHRRLIVGYLDDDETYSAGVVLNAISRQESPYDLFYLMGILNSATLNHWYRKSIIDVSIRVVDLGRVPIRALDFSDRREKGLHDRMLQLVERILTLQQRRARARLAAEQRVIQREIDATDRQIDELVYELYGLTDDEIAIVEESV